MSFRFTFTQDSVIHEQDYVELGLGCADICKALDRGINGKRPDRFSPSVCEAMDQLTKWVEPVTRSSGTSP